MKLIVGLGNPGLRYKNTRHNVGFMAAKETAQRFRIPLRKKRYKSVYGEGAIEGEKIAILLPQTYMNLSGESVRETVKKKKIDLNNLLVICDDIDLKLGFLRLRSKGSSGGHKGLQSIIEHLNTSDFPRLRIGIGGSRKAPETVNFVLSPFDFGERVLLGNMIDETAECVGSWVKFGPARTMTRFNKRQGAW